MNERQKTLIEFACKYPTWHTYSTDLKTMELICATANLGIIKINGHGQFILKSHEKAERFLKDA